MNETTQTESAPVIAAKTPGSIPLAGRDEIYARSRALCHSPTESALAAGMDPRSGICTRKERSQKIIDRIRYLSRQEEETHFEKRAELETFWWRALRNDPARYWEGGRLKPFDEMEPEARQLIEGLTYTEKGKPNLKLVSKTQANVELKKMLGMDAPAKAEVAVSSLEEVVQQVAQLRAQAISECPPPSP